MYAADFCRIAGCIRLTFVKYSGVRAADVGRMAIQSAQILSLSYKFAQGLYGSVAVATMTTSGAANGRERYCIKECPVGKEMCQEFISDPKSYGDTKDEVIDKFKEHLRCVHHLFGEQYLGVVESLCDNLETGTFFDTAAADTPTPPMPASASTPNQPAT